MQAASPPRGGFVALVVTAQALVQIGAFALPALLPGYIARWDLSKTDAGWLIGIFFAAYVGAVPVLVAMTDRWPARSVYLAGAALTALSHLGFALWAEGFWSGMLLRALAGIGWAGCYMPGLRVLADTREGAAQSRAVSWHAAGIGIAGALSFLVAGALERIAGAQGAFLLGAACGAVAFLIAAAVMPRAPPARARASVAELLDFRPVLRNRAAMGWIAGYAVHTWELAALRAFGVTFLASTAARQGTPGWWPDPTVLFTLAGLIGIAVSVTGNELSQRLGRARVVAAAMGLGAGFALATGWTTGIAAPLALALVLLWNAAIYLDSSALTAGTVAAAEPARRGATMGLHSMCGYAGGFLGPLGVGVALDLAGGDGVLGWGLGFGHLAAVTLLGLVALRRFGRG
ncbi:MAG TPA: MFS transporter [Acetobacteraceae bacterium]|nr:MFS transporter [Acetobacteraceae bacterium]